MSKILITGAGGQIGTVLTASLKEIYGEDALLATDLKPNKEKNILQLDILDLNALEAILTNHKVSQIYHLAAILSAKGESDPKWAWEVNMGGFFNIMELAIKYSVEKVFFPSTIAVFGSHLPLTNTPNHVPLIPSTVYGISKVSGEMWCDYYYHKKGLDVRSIRFPGVIGYQTLAGGGTTDYAVDIFHANAKSEVFECFLSEDTILPMIFIDDCIRATIELMQAPKEKISVRTSYNISGMSFGPAEIAQEIKKHNPKFQIIYKPDFREKIARTWPQSIDDSLAKKDWGWMPKYDLTSMTEIMIKEVNKIYNTSNQN